MIDIQTRTRGALALARQRKGTNTFTGLYGSNGLEHSTCQEYRALGDPGTQCTLMSSSYQGAKPISVSGVTEGSQQLTLLEAEVSLMGNEWQMHPIVTGPEAL